MLRIENQSKIRRIPIYDLTVICHTKNTRRGSAASTKIYVRLKYLGCVSGGALTERCVRAQLAIDRLRNSVPLAQVKCARLEARFFKQLIQ